MLEQIAMPKILSEESIARLRTKGKNVLKKDGKHVVPKLEKKTEKPKKVNLFIEALKGIRDAITGSTKKTEKALEGNRAAFEAMVYQIGKINAPKITVDAPRRPTSFTCMVTERDANRNIKKFTITPNY